MPNRKTNKSQSDTNNSPSTASQSSQESNGRRTRLVANTKGKLLIKPKIQTAKNKSTPNKLKILFTIVARNKAEFYIDLIQSFDVNMQIAVLANGMAPKSIVELLGLTSNEKVVIISVIQEAKVSDALAAIEQKFSTIKDGKGIAFTVPMTSVIGTLIYGFLSNNKMAVKEDKTK